MTCVVGAFFLVLVTIHLQLDERESEAWPPHICWRTAQMKPLRIGRKSRLLFLRFLRDSGIDEGQARITERGKTSKNIYSRKALF